jgi:tRNA A-37 threonylcarbamoyl transferase component Bud32
LLSTHDATLAERDPVVPGLSLVLDADALADRVAADVPGLGIASSHAEYVRYKPRGGCIVAYRLETDHGEFRGVARAFRADAAAKTGKDAAVCGVEPLPGVAPVLLFDDQRASFSFFPNDRRLPALRKLADDATRQRFLRRTAPSRPELWDATATRLAYKPARRFVAELRRDDRRAVLRLYGAGEFASALRAQEAFAAASPALAPSMLGSSDRHRAIVTTWMPGTPLEELLESNTHRLDALRRAGQSVAHLHRHQGQGLSHRTQADERAEILAAASAIAAISPDLAGRAHSLARRLTAGLSDSGSSLATIHGDLTADQIVVDDATVGLIDLDRAAIGDPATDLGKMLAGFERDAVYGRVSEHDSAVWSQEFLDGYRVAGGSDPGPRLDLHSAFWLLTFAVEPFRQRQPDWPTAVRRTLDAAEAHLT